MFYGSVNGVLGLLNDPSQNRNASPEGSVVCVVKYLHTMNQELGSLSGSETK